MFHKVAELSAIKQRDEGIIETYSQLCKNLEKIWDYRAFMDGSKTEEAIAKNAIKKMLKVYANWTKNNPNKNKINGILLPETIIPIPKVHTAITINTVLK